MNILREILDWSLDRPAWQRDALRRLLLNGSLAEDDIRELTEVCKSGHGLADLGDPAPLADEHVPAPREGITPVSLVSLFHQRGVNALADDQTLNFGPQLTIVYGDNGAGKTGYTRILKSACRARGQEKILANVVSGGTPFPPVVAIKYKTGSGPELREWTGGSQDEFVSRVSIFDTQCAAVYLTEKTDVAFRPFGLDLFDDLVKACRSVRARLENDQRALGNSSLPAIQSIIPQGTAVAKFLSGVSSLTTPESVRALGQLTGAENDRLAVLEKSLADLAVAERDRLIRQLALTSKRVRALAQHLKRVETALSDAVLKDAFDIRDALRRKAQEANQIRSATFPDDGVLSGTGTKTWAVLWEAARRFSREHAYPGDPFPVLTGSCVLCQQHLDGAAVQRLKQFEGFVASRVEQELRELNDLFAAKMRGLAELSVTTAATPDALDDMETEYGAVTASITAAFETNEKRRSSVLSALADDQPLHTDLPRVVSVAADVEALCTQIDARLAALRDGTNERVRNNMTAEARELRARRQFAPHQAAVLGEIERRKKYAAYAQCLEETRTQAITAKSTAVTKAAISERLKQSFQDELVSLSFRHVEVELKEVGGSDGVLFHKLVLTRAPGVDLPKVVSEGEQRCLSIAAFFAELSTADDPSGIVFDDPVSSLDYRWRNDVARRLVKESRKRQVVVFTHDVVFLLALRQYAEELGVEALDQHVRHLPWGAGICAEELPWVALSVKKKIGYLKKEWQAAEKRLREGQQDAYEKDAKYLYGLLREAWERALEEVLLGGVVERFRPSVQTQQISKISDVTAEDCRVLEAAMTKCSTWLPGHDKAAAARAPVPGPSELKDDIGTLEQWVAEIHKRRR